MTQDQFHAFWKELNIEEEKLLIQKGGEYSGHLNRFSNFERIAAELNLHPLEVAWVYATKHKDAISTFIKEKQIQSNESITSRINDLRNYLALIGGMIDHYKKLPIDDSRKLN